MTQDADINGAYTAPFTDELGDGAPPADAYPDLNLASWTMEQWGREIRAAAQQRGCVTAMGEDRIRRYGQGFKLDWPSRLDDIYNHPFLFVNSFTAYMAFDTPRVHCQSVAPALAGDVPQVIETALNCWMLNEDFLSVIERAAWRIAFDACAIVVGLEEIPETELLIGAAGQLQVVQRDPNTPLPLRPFAAYVPPNRLFWDTRATDPDKAAWCGHATVKSKAWCLKNADTPEYEIAVEALAADAGIAEVLNSDGQLASWVIGEEIERDDIVVLECWCRETNLIHTFAFPNGRPGEGEPVEIASPRPHKGHEDGPYVMMGIDWIDGNAWPYAPLAPTDAVNNELNAHRGQMRDDAAAAKRFMITGTPELAERVEGSPNNAIVPIPGYKKGDAEMFEIGGVQEANAERDGALKEDLRLLGGVSPTSMGDVQADVSATADAEASARLDQRIDKAKKKFRGRVVKVLERVVDLLLGEPDVEMWVTRTDEATGERVTALFQGGQHGAQISRKHLSLSIVPYSMEYVGDNAMRQRQNELFESLIAFSDAAVARPFIRWKDAWEMRCDAFNYGPAASRLIDFGALQQHVQMQQQMQAMNAEAGTLNEMDKRAGKGGGWSGQTPAAPATQRMRSGAAQLGAASR